MVEFIKTILSDFPEQFDVVEARKKYQVKREESLNTVLIQELERYNGLIKLVRDSLTDIRKATEGLIVFSFALEKMAQTLKIGKVPNLWMKISYPSLKPLGGYLKDLIKRIQFFEKWVLEGKPKEFWISGLYSAQAFLTGIRQNYARKKLIAIDKLEFDMKVKITKFIISLIFTF